MKKIVQNFNNFVSRTIFKVQNKTNSNLKKSNIKISNFNKYFIILFISIFIYLFYLLVPLLYDKNWVQNTIEKKLLNEFKINLSSSADIIYRILPAPHYIIKDSKILVSDIKEPKSIAEIKDLKIFLSQKNFFDKEKMNIKRVVIKDANFSFIRNDLKMIDEFSNKNFSNKMIKVNNSKIFFKDNSDQIITIIKIKKAHLFFDNEKLLNFFKLRGEIFAIPFIFDFSSQNQTRVFREINFEAKSLKLDIFNKSINDKNQSITGNNIISFINSSINSEYYVKDGLVFFKSKDSKIKNLEPYYEGKLSINPFDLELNVDLGNFEILRLLNVNSILNEFIKSGLLSNNNISVKITARAKSKFNNRIFQNAEIRFNIVNGKINFDNTKLINDNIGFLVLKNSNLFVRDNKLLLNTDLLIEIKNSDNLFSFLNTSKKSKKLIKKILVNLDYDFLSNQIKFNNVKVDDNKVDEQFLRIMTGFNDNNLNNITKGRRLINELLDVYEG